MRFAVIRRTKFVSFSAVITFLTSSATPTTAPADIGIAAAYPGDKNIASDPAVILADDFEGYTSVSQLTSKWSQVAVPANLQIATGEHYAGAKSLQMSLFPSTVETGVSVHKRLSPTLNTLYCRAYMKWDAGYNVIG